MAKDKSKNKDSYSPLQGKVYDTINKVLGGTYYNIALTLSDGKRIEQATNLCYLAPEGIMGSIVMALHMPEIVKIEITKTDERPPSTR